MAASVFSFMFPRHIVEFQPADGLYFVRDSDEFVRKKSRISKSS